MKSDVNNSTPSITVRSESTQHLSRTYNLWESAWNAIAKGKSWSFFLIAIGSLSSVIYPHVPLVGFAVVAGNTLTRKKAIFTAFSIWFANQFYGFTIRQYPPTLESFTWGFVMGIGTIIVTRLITFRPQFCVNFWGYITWLIVGIISGYAIYQGTILIIVLSMGGHGFSSEILWRIFVKDAVWALGLSAVHTGLIGLMIQTAPSQSGYRPPGCGQKY